MMHPLRKPHTKITAEVSLRNRLPPICELNRIVIMVFIAFGKNIVLEHGVNGVSLLSGDLVPMFHHIASRLLEQKAQRLLLFPREHVEQGKHHLR